MLATLGIAADVDADAVLTESTADLRTEVVADCYVRAFCTGGGPSLDAKQARGAARAAFDDPHARLEPEGPPDSDALLRKQFGDAVRLEVGRRKRDRRLLDYDDLLTQLRDALLDERTGARLADAAIAAGDQRHLAVEGPCVRHRGCSCGRRGRAPGT
jgi:exodeoxyribonuclease V beta subunit